MRNQHVGIAAIAIVVSISVGSAQQTADTVLYNGKILTVDSDFNTAQAVAGAAPRLRLWEPTMKCSSWPGRTHSGLI